MVIGNLRALAAAFVAQWRQFFAGLSGMMYVVNSAPTIAVAAWMATRSEDPTFLTFFYFGAPLLAIWALVSFQGGWSLQSEVFGQTLEPMIMSRTPMMIVMMGKFLSITAIALLSAPISFLTVLAVSQRLPEVPNPLLLVISLFVALMALVVTSFPFAPLYALAGGRPGLLIVVSPLGIVLGGFLYPVEILPSWLTYLAQLFPTSWAMDGVFQSVQTQAETWVIIRDWLVSAGLASLWLVGTFVLAKKVEKRLRLTGALARG